ncbi:putative DCC family thiol-disulfide oxidoreductase YuxK [Sinobacterium caligoides]|uniref:Putative DCC family thiol-disulfide oxidoreductase YuxK n=1 Tax=Sinobacterium caligoides TaxID=933926 RepID=A0A3N2DKF2_9GAMM|nr:DCC1-like thiol-disulfide oxidoreductase family protein [Sinobacterium caligoides]ROS00248.1 putative DCC family thiol-disulfide oxidoreductase YuxK [Sinobacterium caligoides]
MKSSYSAEQLMCRYPQIILFDGVCHLCSGWVQFVIARDRGQRFYFCSVQSAVGKLLLAECGLPMQSIETMVYIQDGTVHLRSTAFLQVVRQLSGGWPLLSLGLSLPASIRDALYTLVARNRYRIAGRRAQCWLADESLRQRFID